MLRRILLAASDSGRMRRLVTTAPVARGVVARYVAGDEAADAVAVAGRLREAGLLVSLDHLGEDTRDARQAEATTGEYTALLARLATAGLTAGAAAEVSVKPTAVGLGLADHGEKTATENISRICAAATRGGHHGHRGHGGPQPCGRDAAHRARAAGGVPRPRLRDPVAVAAQRRRLRRARCARFPGQALQGCLQRPAGRGVHQPRRGGPLLRAVPAGAHAGRRLPDAGHP